MSESDRAPIPKFGSFRPQPKVSTSEGSKHDRQPSARKDTKHRRRSKDRETAAVRCNGGSDGVASERKSASPSRKLEQASSAVNVRPDDFFIVDRRGDSKNLEYGSIHRYDVPSYYRSGRGRVLGASMNVRLAEPGTSRKAVLVRDGHRRMISERPLALKRLREPQKEFRVTTSRGTNSTWDLEKDEIPFRLNDGDPAQAVHDETLELVDYRSIEGKVKESDQPDDDDLEVVSEPLNDLGVSTEEVRARQENALLSRETKENPKSLSSWLRLVDHQKEVLFPGRDTVPLTTSERRALADIRLSIYHQAAKHFSTRSSEHEILSLDIMTEREAVLGPVQMSNKWLEVLHEHPTSIRLWTRYLDHLQSNHHDFSFETCKAKFLRCLNVISNAGRGVPDTAQLSANQIHVLSRLTGLARDAGYSELATSIWQAVLELCISSSHGLPSVDPDLDVLEKFWESDVARIGEHGSLGFAKFQKHGSGPLRPVPDQIKEPVVEPSFHGFAKQELRLAADGFLSATATEESSDPFRFVMFSDLKDIIEPLLPGMSIETVVSAFLVHHFLPPLNAVANGRKARQLDQYIMQGTAKIECRPVSLTWLFSTAFDDFKSAHGGQSSDQKLVRFIDRVLDRLCTEMPAYEAFSEYYIAFKMQLLPHELNRAKKLIKARPQSLRLYNAYALAEASSGRLEKAREVWRLASGMEVDVDTAFQRHRQDLYFSWIRAELMAGQEQEILAIFARMSTLKGLRMEESLNSVISLRISQDLQRQWADAIDQKLYHVAASVAECTAYFQYITEDRNLETAMKTFQQRSAVLLQHDAQEETELLHEAKIRILDDHMSHRRAYKPALVRSELRESLRLCPNNTVFLRAYAEHESRFDFNDRVRVPFRDELTSEGSSTLITLAFGMDQELDRYAQGAGGASEHSVRNLFVMTLLQPSPAQHSFPLWKKWFLFEHPSRLDTASSHIGADRRRRMLGTAKQVFLDGLRNLPWHKEWAMIGMECDWGPDGLTERELKQVYGILFERELRVRTEMKEHHPVQGDPRET